MPAASTCKPASRFLAWNSMAPAMTRAFGQRLPFHFPGDAVAFALLHHAFEHERRVSSAAAATGRPGSRPKSDCACAAWWTTQLAIGKRFLDLGDFVALHIEGEFVADLRQRRAYHLGQQRGIFRVKRSRAGAQLMDGADNPSRCSVRDSTSAACSPSEAWLPTAPPPCPPARAASHSSGVDDGVPSRPARWRIYGRR